MQKKTNKALNHVPKLDFPLCIAVLLLLSLGVVMVLSASAPQSLAESGKSYAYFQRQLIFAIIGIVAMFIISKINYRIYLRFYKLIYVVSVLILLLVLVPGIGKSAGGATRWIELAGIRFQPSEITKIGLVIFYAGYFTQIKEKVATFKYGFLYPMIALAIPLAILYFIQDHLSGAILIGLTCSAVMIVAGTKMRYFMGAGAIRSLWYCWNDSLFFQIRRRRIPYEQNLIFLRSVCR